MAEIWNSDGLVKSLAQKIRDILFYCSFPLGQFWWPIGYGGHLESLKSGDFILTGLELNAERVEEGDGNDSPAPVPVLFSWAGCPVWCLQHDTVLQ